MLQVSADLIERHSHGASQELRLRAPTLARQLTPGQPVLVRTGAGGSPYLRRVFYPIAIDEESWTLRIPASGDWGHAWLRAMPTGSQIDCLGPVGKGYKLLPTARNVLCLGEGEAAWHLLAATLRAEAAGSAVTLAVEVTSEREAIPPGRLPAGVEYRLASQTPAAARRRSGGERQEERGSSAPVHGSREAAAADGAGLADWAGELLTWADVVLAAGSLELYRRLAIATKQARYGLSAGFAQVLYPAEILCGSGACHACATDVAGRRRRVCLRGPVFDLVELEP